MTFEFSKYGAAVIGNRWVDVYFDTLTFEPVANWRERAPDSAPQRTLEKRLVAK
ncbi:MULTISPECIES: hypothetical protein [unclassified Mesorhizobium]|jgi:hypothetical protein|uniref:hypothetical protein n=1 Tax=unclassified Mesorhizobium TaxID=325217 RepID=UPI001929282B|nr:MULTISPECIES: hypothetical protein [unclassified Mesorhizobium]